MEIMAAPKLVTGMCRYFNHKWQDKVYNCDGYSTYRECVRKECDHAQRLYSIIGWINVDKHKERRCNHG